MRYNNKPKQAVAGMKLAVNNEVNPGTKKAALKLVEGGPSKINPPNSRPSNPIHKTAMAAQTGKPQPKKEKTAGQEEPTSCSTSESNATSQHEINKTAVIIGGVGVVALILIALR